MLDIKLFRMNAGKDNLDALDVLINNSSSRQKINTIVPTIKIENCDRCSIQILKGWKKGFPLSLMIIFSRYALFQKSRLRLSTTFCFRSKF